MYSKNAIYIQNLIINASIDYKIQLEVSYRATHGSNVIGWSTGY